MAFRPPPLTNAQKAAILMVAVGPDAATQLFQHMSQDQVEVLTVEIARMGRVTPETRENIVEEFHDLCIAQEFIAEGGLDAAKDLLASAFGQEKADQIVGRVLQALQVMPFDFLKKA
ncbi:MAG: flagellar motor switch protein FliG, partial [Armatimonadota bacterium]|nr:flagellar motor switch protein FliG [Armatimonadota bacterium]